MNNSRRITSYVKLYGSKLDKFNPNQSSLDTITKLAEMDPSKGKEYLIFLIHSYLKSELRLEDTMHVRADLTLYHNNKRLFDREDRDINRFSYTTLKDFLDRKFAVPALEGDINTNASTNDVKVLYEGVLGRLAIPLTEESSCRLGQGTRWCTAGKNYNMFKAYNDEGPLYVWVDYQKGHSKYQFYFEDPQFMDAKDNNIEMELLLYYANQHPVLSQLFDSEIKRAATISFRRLTKLLGLLGISSISSELEETIGNHGQVLLGYLASEWLKSTSTIIGDKELNKSIIASSFMEQFGLNTMYDLVIISRGYLGTCNWPEIEGYLAQLEQEGKIEDPRSFEEYLGDWIESNPFGLEGTPLRDAIMKRPDLIIKYMTTPYAKGRWDEAETIILSGVGERYLSAMVEYSDKIIGGPWPEAEQKLKASTHRIYYIRYLGRVIGRRDPELEAKLIKSSASDAIEYAFQLKIASWPELEDKLLNDIYWTAYISDYCSKVRGKQRWIEAEKVIIESRSANSIRVYHSNFVKERWPLLEAMKEGPPLRRWLIRNYPGYGKYFNGEWKEAEDEIKLTLQTIPSSQILDYLRYIMQYIDFVKKQPWLEMEPYLLGLIENAKFPQDIVDILTQYAIKYNHVWPELEDVYHSLSSLGSVKISSHRYYNHFAVDREEEEEYNPYA